MACTTKHVKCICDGSSSNHPAFCSGYTQNSRFTYSDCTMQYDAIEVQAYNAANPADAAQVVQKTMREPGQGEVLVQMKYAGVRPRCSVVLL